MPEYRPPLLDLRLNPFFYGGTFWQAPNFVNAETRDLLHSV
jgi:hypothetical protein